MITQQYEQILKKKGQDNEIVHQQQHRSNLGCKQKTHSMKTKHQVNGPTNMTNWVKSID